MPKSDPRPRASIWGKYWTVGHDREHALTLLTLYDSVPMPRMDYKLTRDQVTKLIHDLTGEPIPPTPLPDDTATESQPMILGYSDSIDVNNSDVLQPLNSLAFIIDGAATFKVTADLILQAESAGPGFQVGCLKPWADGFGASFSFVGKATAFSDGNAPENFDFDDTTQLHITSTGRTYLHIEGVATNLINRSLFMLGFAQWTPTAEDCLVNPGSTLQYERIS